MPDETLKTESITIDAPASLPGAPATSVPAVSATVAYDPLREYVADGAFGASFAFAHSLPEYVDDLTHDLGADLYERMMNDAQIAGDVRSLRLAILANGVTLLPAVKEGEPRHAKAATIRDFCQRLLDRINLVPVLHDMLGALALGNRVAELVWRIEESGPDAGRIVLDRIKPKHRKMVAFVVDNRGNLLGILGAMAGRSQWVMRQGSIVDPAQTPNFLPRGKFAVLSYAPENSDPRGTPILRAAYNPWWLKQQAWADLLRHLAQFGGGVLVGYTSEDANPIDQEDANGNIKTVTPEQAMVAQLLQIRAGSCAAFPFGAKVEPVVVAGAAAPFLSAIELYDRQISKAILSQTLTTNEGVHQSRAATGEQKDVFDLLVEFGESALATMIRQDILLHAVIWNFGESAKDLVPFVTLSKIEEADLAGLATAVAALEKAGYLTPSQRPGLDAKLGIPVRLPAETAAEEARLKQADAASTSASNSPALKDSADEQ